MKPNATKKLVQAEKRNRLQRFNNLPVLIVVITITILRELKTVSIHKSYICIIRK